MSKIKQLKKRKSIKILKTTIPFLLIGILIEYFLIINHSSLTNGTKYIAVDIAYVIGIIAIFILAIITFCSIIALIVDMIEIWLIGKVS